MIEKRIIAQEADMYFFRNRMEEEKAWCSDGMRYFLQFYDENRSSLDFKKILEVGCGTGYNLCFAGREYGLAGYGIDPSAEAVKYGNAKIKSMGLQIELKQGFSDELPYENDFFDIIYFGFCLYSIDRELLLQTLSEGNRVLKYGGGICSYGF